MQAGQLSADTICIKQIVVGPFISFYQQILIIIFMLASEVHETEIRERSLLGAQTSLFIAKVLMT
jgi:hypothetical protein